MILDTGRPRRVLPLHTVRAQSLRV